MELFVLALFLPHIRPYVDTRRWPASSHITHAPHSNFQNSGLVMRSETICERLAAPYGEGLV